MSNFDVNGYNSHECDIHNHGYYLGAQSQQAKIDDLQARIDSLTIINESLVAYKNQLLDEIEEKGNKDEN